MNKIFLLGGPKRCCRRLVIYPAIEAGYMCDYIMANLFTQNHQRKSRCFLWILSNGRIIFGNSSRTGACVCVCNARVRRGDREKNAKLNKTRKIGLLHAVSHTSKNKMLCNQTQTFKHCCCDFFLSIFFLFLYINHEKKKICIYLYNMYNNRINV
jgi:hypothetical protein